MKKILISAAFILISIPGFSQDDKIAGGVVLEETVYTQVEVMPQFSDGGDAELKNYLQNNLKYPVEAKEKKIKGTVFVSFVVDKTGKVRDAKILRGVGYGCDEEVLRILSTMPDWIPGKQKGVAVNVQYNLPVNFTL
ncbi:MAG TPA: energy transducer TonB [Bacteroidia bacterium]|nr:energy transducer TonB [Bacteroidia bacterium]